MPKSRKPLKQKTLLEFIETSSPTRRGQVESGPPSSSPVGRPTRRKAKGKGKALAKRKIASPSLLKNDDESGSDGNGSTSSDVGAIGFERKVITVSSSEGSEEEVGLGGMQLVPMLLTQSGSMCLGGLRLQRGSGVGDLYVREVWKVGRAC